jgi:hypothetical protein
MLRQPTEKAARTGGENVSPNEWGVWHVGLVLFFFIPETVGWGFHREGNENVCLFVELAVHTRQSLLASMLAGERLDQPNMPLLP